MARAAGSARGRAVVDPRLLIGLALVIASVVGVVGLLSAVDTRTRVYAAAAALSPGDRIDRGDLVERAVALDGAESLYLGVDELPEDGLVVVRAVRDGELLPRTALGDDAGLRSTSLVLELASPVAAAVHPGAAVDVWSTALDIETRAYGAPAVLVADAVVVRVLEDDSLVGASSGGAVEVLVPRSRLARILQAQAAGDALAVVAAGLPWGG
ncbi:hypothetical protein [Protaetiibacter larvae]|uniref:SAF domain-containing protein n=1 Tax=Protaetiibacter larvae TaxID=2592654 RepID=A0A5C1Y487_9MICO|nr:hypothetical protein [Protaetiibacter larvae]QEO08576.1 hypothetical protein FLP23_00150 [Protaetiibacter larvae]